MRMAWCTFSPLAFARFSTSVQVVAGNRIDRTTVLRLFPLPEVAGWFGDTTKRFFRG